MSPLSDEESTSVSGTKTHETGLTSRRRLLAGTAGLLAGAIGTTAGTAGAADRCPVDGFSYPIQRGTPYETNVHVVEADQQGPTAVVIAGMHGDEPAGFQAAHDMVEWQLNRGTLVIVPEADAEAVERGTRHSSVGYLNRQFPTGREPTSALARDLWDTVTLHDPELVIDMHSSRGIWNSEIGYDGYGQAIFPTSASGTRENADKAATSLNNHALGDYPDSHQFTVGNTLTGERPLLIHKVAGDLQRAGYITEVTKDDTTLTDRREWSKWIVAALLRLHGIETSYASDHF